MPDLHAKLLTEAVEYGDGTARFNLHIECGGQGCLVCRDGWLEEGARHLYAVPNAQPASPNDRQEHAS